MTGTIEKVEAYKVWAVYADYDGMAPNTEDLIYLSDAKLAMQLTKHINQNPREWNIAVTEGFEGYKTFRVRHALIEAAGEEAKIHQTMESALSAFRI